MRDQQCCREDVEECPREPSFAERLVEEQLSLIRSVSAERDREDEEFRRKKEAIQRRDCAILARLSLELTNLLPTLRPFGIDGVHNGMVALTACQRRREATCRDCIYGHKHISLTRAGLPYFSIRLIDLGLFEFGFVSKTSHGRFTLGDADHIPTLAGEVLRTAIEELGKPFREGTERLREDG